MFILSPKQRNMQGGARAVDFPDRSFDLARRGVAPPLECIRPAAKNLATTMIAFLQC